MSRVGDPADKQLDAQADGAFTSPIPVLRTNVAPLEPHEQRAVIERVTKNWALSRRETIGLALAAQEYWRLQREGIVP